MRALHGIATHAWDDWTLGDLLAAKVAAGTTVSLVVPARNEAATVGDVVTRVREALVETTALIDELIVVDSDSTDTTYDVATDAGATVHRSAEIRPDLGSHPGKGEAMWKSLFVTTGDLVVFMDADLLDWDTHFVPGLLGPLLLPSPGLEASGPAALAPRPAASTEVEERAQRASRDPVSRVALVKGFYERPGADGPWEGGRVTELVARPLIATSFPELGGLVQPLAGEWAARRSLLEQLWMPTGYAIELAALIDTVRLVGTDAVAQVDLGRRAHRHQALRDLGGMSTQIVAAALARLGAREVGAPAVLRQHGPGPGGMLTSDDRDVVTVERPPAGGVGG
ncbi:Glucosyl-3-phosphoglycerate synthase [Nocardioides aquaticus]|uniref:Glucosyl-3-phosphoglycerate synthase n=1 Tax=Nocardioides aquaticus TaxID=160826 RepID=A0ABX8EED2_9ACTN|nr:glucosyl-3-phosphoglycerate synthase [Nocardioides aquaticus]QVT78442.1 Glucosyl-3-phosphoglycerate synthase [Nocardioides aquaticus]